jgi:hypothetical protein
MFKKQRIKHIIKPSLQSKIGIVDLRKTTLSNKSYSVTYSLKGKSLSFGFLQKNARSNYRDLKEIYLEILKVSKEKKLKRIVTNTWIFTQKKDLATKLGFKLLKGTDKKINLISEKYPNYKIKGIEQRMDLGTERFGTNIYLVLENKKLNNKEYVYLDKNDLPIYIKEL